MKRKVLIMIAAALILAACNNNKAPRLNNLSDTLSWALGENFALTLKQSGVKDVDEELVIEALRRTLEGNPKVIDDTTYFLAIQYIMNRQQQASRPRPTADPQQVAAEEEAFLANLEATNPKVKKHPAGFYYEVLREGKGPKAAYAQRIRFDYRSFLMLTGEPYDQTYGKRESIIHVIGNPMFPGLIEGLQLMNAGSIYRFYFPYQLAFGERGSGDIPGYTPFIYEVELHELFPD